MDKQRSSAMSASSDSPVPSSGRIRRNPILPARDLRLKIISLLLLSALGPVLLVGTASYLTARSIMTEKITSQLEVQATWAAARVYDSFADRSSDAEVFSGAVIVSENLRIRMWARRTGDDLAAEEAQARLRQYLQQIRDRYPLYESLLIIDVEGNPVAAASALTGEPAEELTRWGFESGREADLIRHSRGPLLYARRSVLDGDNEAVGYLVTVSSLDDLWQDLGFDRQAAAARLRVLSEDGDPLFDSHAGEAQAAGLADATIPWGLLRAQTVAAYRGDRGRDVLGALRFVGSASAAVLVEIDRSSAFAATHRLRDFTLIVSILATLLVASIGLALVINLTRPIEALIAGAKAAARGDLTQEIPVISSDQIGYLTKVFNRMIRTIRESRARLERLSSTDELTGLLNRRDLTARFEAELNRAVRLGDPLAVLMIDLDGFKAFNDRFGHLEGDAVLRHLGEFLSGCLRSIDVAVRYGGEEFLVLLPSTDRESAVGLAERLRSAFSKIDREFGEADVTVTFSVGVAALPEDGQTAGELIEAADGALYAAKRQGRDQVQVAGPARSSPRRSTPRPSTPLAARAVEPAVCGSTP